MYEHILIPLDNSPADATILNHIRELARMCRSRITLVHVADGFAARNQERMAESPEMREDREYLEMRRNELAGEGFETTAILECGDPADRIIATAESHNCNLIAMSTHGHRIIGDLILGSVASAVRHRTSIPVLLLRSHE